MESFLHVFCTVHLKPRAQNDCKITREKNLTYFEPEYTGKKYIYICIPKSRSHGLDVTYIIVNYIAVTVAIVINVIVTAIILTITNLYNAFKYDESIQL